MSTTTILIHRFMKTKHKLLKLIHQLGDTFDGEVNFFLFPVQIQRVMGPISKEYLSGLPFKEKRRLTSESTIGLFA